MAKPPSTLKILARDGDLRVRSMAAKRVAQADN